MSEPASLRILQVCNVGNICGGTAACAWTITRALPHARHTVLFRTPPTVETRQAFAHCDIDLYPSGMRSVLARRPQLVLWHNAGETSLPKTTSALSIQYLHSAGTRGDADLTVACSRWLADKQPRPLSVLYQPVPVPPGKGERQVRVLEVEPIIGRLCTPVNHKWPEEIVEFHAALAQRFPNIRWEFVGAPESVQNRLSKVCGGRARFWPAGWDARRHLWRWHSLLYHHPTLTESFGRTVAEAMRAGCVPIVDNRGGFREQVRSGTSGFLCDSLDEFAESVEQVSDPSRRWSLAQAARREADDRFSLRRFSRSLAGVICEHDRCRGAA